MMHTVKVTEHLNTITTGEIKIKIRDILINIYTPKRNVFLNYVSHINVLTKLISLKAQYAESAIKPQSIFMMYICKVLAVSPPRYGFVCIILKIIIFFNQQRCQ